MGTTLQESQFNVFHTTAPSGTTPYATLANGISMQHLAAKDNTLFALDFSASGSPKLYAIDVTNPAAPTLLNSITVAINARSLSVIGDYCYVTGSAGAGTVLRVYDISNPSAITQVSTFTHSLASQAIGVFGSMCVVGGTTNVVHLYDISEPTAPRLLSTFPSNPGLANRGFSLYGSKYIIIADNATTIKVYDISNPLSPIQVSTRAAASSTPRGVDHFGGRHIFVMANAGPTFHVYDFINVASVPSGNTLSSVSSGYSVVAEGTRAFANGNGSSRVINTSTPTSPAAVGTITQTGQQYGLISIDGFLFTTTATVLYVYRNTYHFMQQLRTDLGRFHHADILRTLLSHGPVRIASSLNIAGATVFNNDVALGDLTLVSTEKLHAGPYKHKTADESINSSTSLQADDHLSVNLTASKNYNFRFLLHLNNDGAAAGIKLALSGTAGITSMKAQVRIYDDTTNALVGFDRITAFNSGVTAALSAGAAHAIIEGTIEVSTAGTFLLHWAQNSSDASNTTALRNSTLKMLRF
jgi:hypothetical protein